MLTQIASLSRQKSCNRAQFFDAFRAQNDSDPAASLVSQPLVFVPLVFVAWLHADRSNKLACGGVRHGGKRRTARPAALLSRWVGILSITTGSPMQAMILM